MNVLILGAGSVGGEIARVLVKNQCMVTIVDTRENRLLELQKSLDLRGIAGNAADPEVLLSAGGEDADLVIAITAIDEVNLVACKLCTLLFNTPKKIARIRGGIFANKEIYSEKGFGINHIFCPEQIVADNIISAIRHPGSLEVHPFANNKAVLASIAIAAKSPLAGESIKNARTRLPDVNFRVVSLYRDNKPLKPAPDTRFFVGDEVSLITADKNMVKLAPLFSDGNSDSHNDVMIAGGGNIGQRVATAIETGCNVKLIEIAQDRCRKLAQELKNTLVLKGSATDEQLLKEEGIHNTDFYCGLTNDDEENILSAMLAKRLGARKTVAIVNRETYVNILKRQLDIVVSPSQLTIGSVLAHIRWGDVSRVHSLHHGSTEAIEAVIHGNADTSLMVGRKMIDINWPEEATPGAIVRGDDFLLANDDTVIEGGDRLIVLVRGRDGLKQVEKLLQVSFLHF